MNHRKLKYTIFFVGYGGSIYNAYKNKVVDVEILEDSPELVADIMSGWESQGWLRKDLTYVIFPVYIFDKE